MLYTPPEAIESLAVEPHGIVAIADSPDTSDFSTVRRWTDRGVPILGVVAADPGPALPRGLIDVPAPRPTRRRRTTVAAGVAGVSIGVAAAWGWLGSREPGALGDLPAAPTVTSTLESPPVSPAPSDSLYYSVQLAAFNTADRAWEYAARLADDFPTANVTPVRIPQGSWYRVILGAVPSPRAADSILRGLWDDGLVEAGHG